MKSFTTLRNLYGSLSNNIETANLTLGDQLINDGIRNIITMPQDWDFLEATKTDTTVANQQAYQLPHNVDKIATVTVTVGSSVYPVAEATSRLFWNQLNVTTFTSTYPEYYYIDGGNLNLYPIPADNNQTITYDYKKAVRDLSNADYTTGTVSLTNASTTVTGSGTTFTASMADRWIKGNLDNFWYEINAFTSTTVVVLRKQWQGATTAGLSYTIGEMPVLPEAYHQLPVFYAVSQYWFQNGDNVRGREYERMFDEGIAKLISDHGTKTTSMVVDDGEGYSIINPNLLITF